MDSKTYENRMDAFSELLELDKFIQPARLLSLGQRMRGDLVAAMIYQPQILFLDKPTVGLDVVAESTTVTSTAPAPGGEVASSPPDTDVRAGHGAEVDHAA
jgi:ABC-type multidrug transport system ATPase subunit